MGRRKGHGGGHANSERWLLTYADLITLLLAFFIILYAVSMSDKTSVADLSRELSSAFHVTSGGSDRPLDGSPNVLFGGGALLPEPKAMMEMQDKLQKDLAKTKGSQGDADAGAGVTTTLTERGLVISLANSSFFEPGEAYLKPRALAALQTVARLLDDSKRNIMVEGHTDDSPINTERYPSNWELSTARATSVVRFLITAHAIPPKRLSAAGYGEYYPVVPNNSNLNRARNRRVDIVILRSDLKGQRPGSKWMKRGVE
jgi:chemotaxis protein MotB